MKAAKSYFRSSYSNNLTTTLRALVKSKKFNELGEDAFTLSEKEARSLEAKLQ